MLHVKLVCISRKLLNVTIALSLVNGHYVFVNDDVVEHSVNACVLQ